MHTDGTLDNNNPINPTKLVNMLINVLKRKKAQQKTRPNKMWTKTLERVTKRGKHNQPLFNRGRDWHCKDIQTHGDQAQNDNNGAI